jgi:hypothetical protein
VEVNANNEPIGIRRQQTHGVTVATATKNGHVAAEAPINLIDIRPRTVVIRIVGDSPLITHAWSEKAKKQMRDKQQGRAAEGKQPKNPEAEMEGATYRLPTGQPAIPTICFKAAAVDAASQVKDYTKVFLRGAFHTVGELAEIISEPAVMREDMVRVGMGTADMRYRPQFNNWSVDLVVRFNPSSISLEQLVNLLNLAGFACGVGEWRPQKDGQFGMFHVESYAEVD